MDSEQTHQQDGTGDDSIELIPQTTLKEDNRLTKIGVGRFDHWSVIVIFVPIVAIVFLIVFLLIASSLISNNSNSFSLESHLLAFAFTWFSATFTLLTIREKKRNREVEHAPTLFLAKRGDELGIKNIGKGLAHEVTAEIIPTTSESGQNDSSDSVISNQIIQPGEFEPFQTNSTNQVSPVKVTLNYGDSLGIEHSDIVRKQDLRD